MNKNNMEKNNMNSNKKNNKRKGSISINILLSLIFISTLICSTLSIYNTLENDIETKLKMIDHDYRSRRVLCDIEMNLYYSIEDVYEKSSVSDDFDKEFRSKNTETYKKIENKEYFKDDRLSLSRNLKIPLKKGDYFVFYLNSNYKEKDFERKGYFRCEVKNPYKHFNLSEKREISPDEIKELVEVVEIRK